jgi:hypothetical protein
MEMSGIAGILSVMPPDGRPVETDTEYKYGDPCN